MYPMPPSTAHPYPCYGFDGNKMPMQPGYGMPYNMHVGNVYYHQHHEHHHYASAIGNLQMPNMFYYCGPPIQQGPTSVQSDPSPTIR